MADYIVKDTELTNIANAIRTAGGTNNSLTFPNGFVSAVENIGGGGGGGSSDFSKAEVTIIPHPIYGSDITLVPRSLTDFDHVVAVFMTIEGLTTNVLELSLGQTETISGYVLSNNDFFAYNLNNPTQKYLVEGSAEALTIDGMNVVKIYGDCTINMDGNK